MSTTDTARISPTAHYTGYVWYQNSLSNPALITQLGKRLYQVVRPFDYAARLFMPGRTLETTLLLRHRLIDEHLDQAIQSGQIRQVVEIASGLSPRGFRFTQKYGSKDLIYIETDLSGMANRKRETLNAAGLQQENHHVITVNALVDSGPESLMEATKGLLDPSRGTAIITEGLINYFDRPTVLSMWRRFTQFLNAFPNGKYLSDIHVSAENQQFQLVRSFSRLLGRFAGGNLYFHFNDESELLHALKDAGFKNASTERPRENNHPPSLVRVIEANL